MQPGPNATVCHASAQTRRPTPLTSWPDALSLGSAAPRRRISSASVASVAAEGALAAGPSAESPTPRWAGPGTRPLNAARARRDRSVSWRSRAGGLEGGAPGARRGLGGLVRTDGAIAEQHKQAQKRLTSVQLSLGAPRYLVTRWAVIDATSPDVKPPSQLTRLVNVFQSGS